MPSVFTLYICYFWSSLDFLWCCLRLAHGCAINRHSHRFSGAISGGFLCLVLGQESDAKQAKAPNSLVGGDSEAQRLWSAFGLPLWRSLLWIAFPSPMDPSSVGYLGLGQGGINRFIICRSGGRHFLSFQAPLAAGCTHWGSLDLLLCNAAEGSSTHPSVSWTEPSLPLQETLLEYLSSIWIPGTPHHH